MIADPRMRVVAVSRFWRTPAHPTGSGPDYVNACAVLRTSLAPELLLALLHEIEAALGRVRDGTRWGARGIDLDLLAMQGLVRPDADLQAAWRRLSVPHQQAETPTTLILPHPRLQDRGFVLAPLAEIAPGWTHPLTGRSVRQMLADLPREGLEGMTPDG